MENIALILEHLLIAVCGLVMSYSKGALLTHFSNVQMKPVRIGHPAFLCCPYLKPTLHKGSNTGCTCSVICMYLLRDWEYQIHKACIIYRACSACYKQGPVPVILCICVILSHWPNPSPVLMGMSCGSTCEATWHKMDWIKEQRAVCYTAVLESNRALLLCKEFVRRLPLNFYVFAVKSYTL